MATGGKRAPPKQSFATQPGPIIERNSVKNDCGYVIHMAIHGENIAPVFAMQAANAFRTSGRDEGVIGPVVVF
jgi:hypothetical protein